jgi:hypothetical protein
MKACVRSLLFHQVISLFVGHVVFLGDVKHNDEGCSVDSFKTVNKHLRLGAGQGGQKDYYLLGPFANECVAHLREIEIERGPHVYYQVDVLIFKQIHVIRVNEVPYGYTVIYPVQSASHQLGL